MDLDSPGLHAENQVGFPRAVNYRPTCVVTSITGPSRIPVLKVTNFCSSFGKIPKIPVLELIVLKFSLLQAFLQLI